MIKSKFKNKIALITGSTQGVGEATARLFVQEGLEGLVICGRNQKKGTKISKELNNLGCKTIFIKADLSDVNHCFKIIKKIDEVFSRLDILVNCAAQTDRGGLLDSSPKLWDSIFATNVKAPFFLMQGAAKIMIRENIKGVMTSVLSIQSYGGSDFLTPYAASKGALKVLTKNVANNLLKKQIRVNGLNLGWTDTPNERQIQKKYHNATKNWIDKAEKKLSFKKLIQTKDVAKFLSFMSSDESGIMSGSIIDFAEIIIGPIGGKTADKL